MSVPYVPNHSVSLKKSRGLDEYWVQQLIRENPGMTVTSCTTASSHRSDQRYAGSFA